MDSDVETILSEIRERVLAEERAATPVSEVTPQTQSPNGLMEPAVVRSETLERVEAGLSVTARAWDRLPPVFSNRRGSLARFELWIKNSFKGLTRWFTWEQVNFNAAVHHALNDLLAVVSAQREELIAHTQKLEAMERESHSLRSLLETQAQEFQRLHSAQAKDRSEAQARLTEIQARFTESQARLTETQARLTEAEAALARFNDMLSGLEARSAEKADKLSEEQRAIQSSLAQRIVDAANELREEQRVCFKQLSLEATEAAILEDRGRRALEARLEKLEQQNSA